MNFVDYKDARPIYEQIYDTIRTLILRQVWGKDEQLPSVRALAMELSINPNTIQKAYSRLEAEGLVYVVKGRGNFVAGNTNFIQLKRKEMRQKCRELLREARLYDIGEEELMDMIRRCKEDMND